MATLAEIIGNIMGHKKWNLRGPTAQRFLSDRKDSKGMTKEKQASYSCL